MTDYFIRQLDDGFEIAKFNPEAAAPSEVYYVDLAHGSCTCPSYTKPCKHWRMVDEWKRQPKRDLWYYDDELEMFVNCGIFRDGIEKLLDEAA